MALTVTLEIGSGNPPASWRDVSDDAQVGRQEISWQRGIMSSSVFDKVAQPGHLTFALDNSAGNTDGVQGRYSPGHVNALAGLDVNTWWARLHLDDGTNARYVFRGKITSIEPTAGSTGEQLSIFTAVDWMEELQGATARNLTLQEFKRADQLITTLVSESDVRAPVATDYDTGVGSFRVAFDDVSGQAQASAMTVANNIVQSEQGWLWVRGDATGGETLQFVSRHGLYSTTFPPADSFNAASGEIADLRAATGRDRIFNVVNVAVYPPQIDPNATTILVDVGRSIGLAVGESLTMWLNFQDPNSEGTQFIGGKNPSLLWSARETEGAGGADLTGSVTMTPTFYASQVKVVMTNNHATLPVWIVGNEVSGVVQHPFMRVQGQGIYRYNPILVEARDTASIGAPGNFGELVAEQVDMPYEGDKNTAQGIADEIVDFHSLSWQRPTEISIKTHTAKGLEHSIDRDLGDRIWILEAQAVGGSEDVVIVGINMTITAGNWIEVKWTLLGTAIHTGLFRLDDATLGKLDTGGTLGRA
jgi:hypothetical protein